MQRNANIAAIAPAAAAAAAMNGSGMSIPQITPTVADTRLPPISDHGCASGLAGTANSSTADAPIGAISIGNAALEPNITCISVAVSARPIKAPADERIRSGHLRRMGPGIKLASQRITLVRDTMSGYGAMNGEGAGVSLFYLSTPTTAISTTAGTATDSTTDGTADTAKGISTSDRNYI